jgi:hypothetical protein
MSAGVPHRGPAGQPACRPRWSELRARANRFCAEECCRRCRVLQATLRAAIPSESRPCTRPSDRDFAAMRDNALRPGNQIERVFDRIEPGGAAARNCRCGFMNAAPWDPVRRLGREDVSIPAAGQRAEQHGCEVCPTGDQLRNIVVQRHDLVRAEWPAYPSRIALRLRGSRASILVTAVRPSPCQRCGSAGDRHASP